MPPARSSATASCARATPSPTWPGATPRRAKGLTPLSGPALEYAFKYHLREAIRNDVVDRATRTSGRLGAGSGITAAFADLVGFTRLGEELAPEGIGGVVDRLGELAAEVAQRPVQLIKLIGDA